VAGVFDAVRYTYRLRPGRIAQAALLAEWDRCRWLWNEAVHQQKTGKKPTFGKLSKMLTEARARFAWLRRGSQNAQQQTLRTYGTALNASFTVPVVWSRELPSDPTSVRVYQDNLGYWYASFVVTRVTAAAPGPALPGIGVDWGVKITATTTNPARIAKKAARQNTHDARVWAKNLVDHHALIAVEDFKPILATAERDRASADDVRHQIASFRDGGSGAV
jgi:putative transposase